MTKNYERAHYLHILNCSLLTKYIIVYGSSLSACITSTGMFWRASNSHTVCTEHLQQTNPFMSPNQYFMPVFLTTESSTETLMVTPLRVLLCWSWLCLKNSWIIQLRKKKKNPLKPWGLILSPFNRRTLLHGGVLYNHIV